MVFVALVLRNNIFLIFFVLAGQHPNLGKFRVAFIHNKANTAKNLVIINENVLSAPNFAPGNTYVYKYETVIDLKCPAACSTLVTARSKHCRARPQSVYIKDQIKD